MNLHRVTMTFGGKRGENALHRSVSGSIVVIGLVLWDGN